MLRAQGLAGEAELTAAFNAARDREYGDIITGCDDAADAPEAMAAACDFRYEQLCGKQARLDQLAGCYRALRDRDLLAPGRPRRRWRLLTALDKQSASGHPRPGYSHNHRAA